MFKKIAKKRNIVAISLIALSLILFLLYNFDFDEKIDRVNTSQYTFTFICSVKYK